MKTAILSVGTELLFGQITNTNTVYLSQQLNLLGFDVLYHYTVGDNSKRLSQMLDVIYEDCDLIIATGGLGPTEDDLTKETVCEYFKDELVMDRDSLENLKERAARLNRSLTPNNYKQAMMPSKATIFPNEDGTAPGFALSNNGKYIICMPGPPREMKAMYEKKVKTYLEKFQKQVIYYRTVRTFGIGESSLETKLLPLIDGQSDPSFATYAKEGECTLRIASKRETLEEAKAAVEEGIEKVKKIVGKYIYSTEDKPLVNVVGEKLIEKNITISCCESCTGGLFAGALTEVSGISAVFDRGLVTYTYRAKEEELGVSKDTLEKYTAVSEQVALEMCQGLAAKTRSDIAISVTGIAGPLGGTEEKPVGLVYIGITCKGESKVHELRMRNVSREWNRHYAVLNMLHIVNKAIDNNW